jgi:hypothetical protein
VLKREQRTRVFVAGEDVSKYVHRVDLHRKPDGESTATITMRVDRLGLNHDQAVNQVLEIHIAEEE